VTCDRSVVNKDFFFRLNNDLLLWEPVAPSPLPTQDQTLGSIQPFDLSCYPQDLQRPVQSVPITINVVTCDRSVVFSGYSGFPHQKICPPRYNWNIVESGIKHHNRYPQVLQNNFELAKSAIQYGRKTYLTRLHRCVFCFHVDNPVSRKYNSMYQITHTELLI
jgi:hypothetical protein